MPRVISRSGVTFQVTGPKVVKKGDTVIKSYVDKKMLTRPKENTNVVKVAFKVGENVEAIWKANGQRYPGVICHIFPQDYYEVQFDDGIHCKKRADQIFKIKRCRSRPSVEPCSSSVETSQSSSQKSVECITLSSDDECEVQSSVRAAPASQPQPTISNQSKGSSNETETPNPEWSDVPTEYRKLITSSWGMELFDHDLESLAEEMFVNDQIIDFWLKYVKRYKITEADKKRTYIFSSFFYSKLTSKQKSENTKIHVTERRHSRVVKWTKNEDIFQYDYLLVPIVENDHWILAVICFPAMDGIYDYDTGEYISDLKTKRTKAKPKSQENSSQEGLSSTDSAQKQKRIPKKVNLETRNLKQPCILIFDSLAQEPRNTIYATLREYLHVEYKVKKGVEKEFSNQTMPGCMPRVPQQPNGCDCGLYLLQFAESFFSHPIKSYKSNFNNELSNWFKDSETRTKRKQIYDAIVELITKDNPANVQHIPKLTFPTAMIQKPKKKTENVVKIQQDVNQDRILDVGVESESSTTSKNNRLM